MALLQKNLNILVEPAAKNCLALMLNIFCVSSQPCDAEQETSPFNSWSPCLHLTNQEVVWFKVTQTFVFRVQIMNETVAKVPLLFSLFKLKNTTKLNKTVNLSLTVLSFDCL